MGWFDSPVTSEPDDGNGDDPRNVGNFLPADMAVRPRIFYQLQSP
jgi:hypothetical protein